MGLFDRLLQRISADQHATQSEDLTAVEELRTRLEADPNDREALLATARRLAAEEHPPVEDPLTASVPEVTAATRHSTALWAVAEEYAGHPHAWVPLIEMARIDLPADAEAAVRRLETACEREPDGRALAAAVAMLREEGHPELAVNLGVARWSPDQDFAAGEGLVSAALEAGDSSRASEFLARLADADPGHAGIADLDRRVSRATR